MKSLSLNADRLGELTADELTSVVAGHASEHVCLATVTAICPTYGCTGCYLTCGC